MMTKIIRRRSANLFLGVSRILNSVSVNSFKAGSVVSLILLSGCSEPESLKFNVKPNSTTNYFAQVEVELDNDSIDDGELPSGYASFNTPISITVNESGETGASVSVQVHDVDFMVLDFRQHDQIKQLISEGITLGRSDAANLTFAVKDSQKVLASNKEVFADYALLKTVPDSGAIQSVAVFPPTLIKKAGASRTKTYSDGFITNYSVSFVSEHRVRVKVDGHMPKDKPAKEMTEDQHDYDELKIRESIKGWADYHPETGQLIQLRMMVKIPVSEFSSLQALVLISDNPLMKPIEEIYGYGYDGKLTRNQSSALVEALENPVRVFNQPTVFTSQESKDPDFLRISAIQQGSIAPILKDFKLLDINNKPLDKQFMVYRYSDTGAYGEGYVEDSIEHKFSGLIAPVTPLAAYLEVNYVPENHTKHTESLRIKDGKVSFSHPQFTVEGVQKDVGMGWQLTITEQSHAEVSHYSLYDDKNEVNVYILEKLVEDSKDYRQPDGWDIAIADQNTYQISANFERDPSGSIAFTWYEQPKQKKTKIPFWHAVASLKEQAPTEKYFNNRSVSEQYTKPAIEVSNHQLAVSIPSYMVALCNFDESPEGDYRGSPYQWLEKQNSRRDESYTFLLSSFNNKVWHFYDDKVNAKLMCSEASLLPLVKDVDYKQSKPWMIELTGKYSSFTWQQAMEELQAYNANGDVIQWVKPSNQADYSLPYLKAWGDIDNLKLIQRKEPKVEFEQLVQFGPLPQ